MFFMNQLLSFDCMSPLCSIEINIFQRDCNLLDHYWSCNTDVCHENTFVVNARKQVAILL